MSNKIITNIIMNIHKWTTTINNLSIPQHTKNTIITLFTHFHPQNEYATPLPITDNKIIKSLNNINSYKQLILSMDAEFQSTITNMYIKELGFLLFTKDKNMYYYIGHIFLNFDPIVDFGIDMLKLKPIYTESSTVTESTFKKMQHNEHPFHLEHIIDPLYTLFNKNTIKQVSNELNNNFIFTLMSDSFKKSIMTNLNNLLTHTGNNITKELNNIKRKLSKTIFEIYGSQLKHNDLYNNFILSFDLYWNDDLVKQRTQLLHNNVELFFNVFKELSDQSIFVIKGTHDITALNNMIKLYNLNIKINFDHNYDIETFNGLSTHLYESSKLEDTYKGLIKTKIYKQFAKPLFDTIMKDIGDKAHNPVVDSLFTIIVAATVNMGLNEYFEST